MPRLSNGVSMKWGKQAFMERKNYVMQEMKDGRNVMQKVWDGVSEEWRK